MQPSFLPTTILLFLSSFLFLVFNWLLVQLSLLRESTITLAGLKPETLQTSWDCKIAMKSVLKHQNLAEMHEFLLNIHKSWQKRSIRTEKRFCFVFAKFSLFHVQKHNVFSKIGIQSKWKHLIQLKRKNNGSSIWDNLSSHFFFCNLDGSSKVLNYCVMCGRKLFSKCKRLYKRLWVVSCDCLGDRCRWCYFWRMQMACPRAQNKLDSILLLCHYSLKWSFEVLAFLLGFFRASTAQLVQCTSNFGKKLKFTEVYVLF